MTKTNLTVERPDWLNIWGSSKSLNEWFDQHVAPLNDLLANGVEVVQDHTFSKTIWDSKPGSSLEATHKALLIGITPIKKDTAEDVLRELSPLIDIYLGFEYKELKRRVKVILNEEE
jgi:hypothetical protein